MPVACLQQNAIKGGKPLRAADGAVLVHEHDEFGLRIDAEAPRLQPMTRFAAHDSVTLWPSSGTRQSQPNSSSIRWRKASDAEGSPCVTKVLRGGDLKPRSQRISSSRSACAESMSRFFTSAFIGT